MCQATWSGPSQDSFLAGRILSIRRVLVNRESLGLGGERIGVRWPSSELKSPLSGLEGRAFIVLLGRRLRIGCKA